MYIKHVLYVRDGSCGSVRVINAEYPLETVQGAWRGHAGHTGPIDGAQLNLRHIEGDGG